MKRIPKILNFLNKPSILLVSFAISSFILRLIPWKSIIVNWGESALYVQPDAYYHLRRATIYAESFPKIIGLDYYMAYPYGAECPWPPLYDYFIAIVSLILGGGTAKHEILRIVTAVLPPVLAALCVYPTYKLAKLIFNNQTSISASATERIAIFSAFLAIIMPGMLGYSHVGSGDHHIAETLLSLWFFYFGVSAVKQAVEAEDYRKNAVAAGIMMALGLLVWQGQVVFFTVFCAYVLWIMIFKAGEEAVLKNIAISAALTGVVAAALTAAGRFIFPRATEQTFFEFVFFSYFQPSYVLLLSVCVIIFYFLIKKASFEKLASPKFLAKSAGAAALAAVLILIFPPVRKGIVSGIKFLLREDPWFASINEFMPTFTWDMLVWPSSMPTVLNYLYMISFAAPFVYGFFVLKEYLFQKNERSSAKVFYFFWGVVIGFLALYQRRWNNAYSPALAIGIALFINAIYLKIKSGHGLFRDFLRWREEHRGEKAGFFSGLLAFYDKSPFLLSLVVIMFFLTPYYITATQTVSGQGYPISEDLYRTLQWIKNYTPKTSYLWEPDKKPEYGIIAPWDHGHYVQYIAERPTINNNFGHALRGDGFKDSIYIWSTESEQEVVEIARKYNARFLLMTDPVLFLGNPVSSYLKPGFFDKYMEMKEFHFGVTMPYPKDEFHTLPMSRMMEFDGSSTAYGPALKHFRLVFESHSPSQMPYHLNEVKAYKIYEYVNGAKIKGRAEPRSIVYFKARFITNWDREFDWEAAAIADGKGNFEGVLPYATAEDNFFIKPISPYMIISGNKFARMDITNADVYEGKEVVVDLAKGESLPKEMQELLKEKLKSSVGEVKSKGFVNIHKKQ